MKILSIFILLIILSLFSISCTTSDNIPLQGNTYLGAAPDPIATALKGESVSGTYKEWQKDPYAQYGKYKDEAKQIDEISMYINAVSGLVELVPDIYNFFFNKN